MDKDAVQVPEESMAGKTGFFRGVPGFEQVECINEQIRVLNAELMKTWVCCFAIGLGTISSIAYASL